MTLIIGNCIFEQLVQHNPQSMNLWIVQQTLMGTLIPDMWKNVSFCVYGRLTRLCTENVLLTTLNWHKQLQTVDDISQNIGK